MDPEEITDLLHEDDKSPRIDSPRFICPQAYCGAFAQQSWRALHVEDEDDFEFLETEAIRVVNGSNSLQTQRVNIWKAAECGSCHGWSIWRQRTMVHPRGRLGSPAHQEMPVAVKELYEEASAVSEISRRAGAAMARAAVERLVRSLDPEAPRRSNLAQRVERIRGQVSTSLADMLDVVRVSGNSALHVEDSPSEIAVMVLDDTEGPELVALLLEVANDLVDELIARPRRAQMLHERLPESIRSSLASQRSADSGPSDQG